MIFVIFVWGEPHHCFHQTSCWVYGGVKAAHLEAGLRSDDRCPPFPKQTNRKLVSRITNYYLAPTGNAPLNLQREVVKDSIWMVGNTVICSLFLGLEIMRYYSQQVYDDFFEGIDFPKRIILVIEHRRESFGKPFEKHL